MNQNDDKIRTFFAIEIPDNFRKSIKNNVIDVLNKLPVKVKWVTEQNIHITVRFIGEIEIAKIDDIVDNVNKSIGTIGEIKLELSRIGYFGKNSPKVIWIGLNGDIDKLEKIHEKIEHACRDAGSKADYKEFSPHITFGRVKSPSHTSELIETIKNIEIPKLNFKTDELVLFKSTLTPAGPIYEAIERLKF
ncbi:RNA 2',3'-cyclic phosphodiesterase [bacterium]|nr:RNA 2',3'-cyclic phosphodiesterase [bacterium]